MTHLHKSRRHEVSALFALVLFGVFAVSVLSVLLTGSDVYNRLVDRDHKAYDRRTCAQYVATKVRQAESGTSVSVSDFEGIDALTLSEDIDGYTYITRIYCFDGWLRELFTAADGDFKPEDGEKVIEAEAMEVSVNDGLLTVNITDPSGEKTEIVLSLRGEEAHG